MDGFTFLPYRRDGYRHGFTDDSNDCDRDLNEGRSRLIPGVVVPQNLSIAQYQRTVTMWPLEAEGVLRLVCVSFLIDGKMPTARRFFAEAFA